MPKSKRNIGLEILQGLRELKHGEYGRVTTVPECSKYSRKDWLVSGKIRSTSGSVRAYTAGLGARSSSSPPELRNPAHDC